MLVRVKLAGMGLLVLASLVLAIGHSWPWFWLVFAALCFSLLGDAFLARVNALARRVRDPFISGMVSFATAQVLYCVAFWRSMLVMPQLHMAVPGQYTGLQVMPLLLPAYVLLGLLGWTLLVMRSDRPRALRLAALAYCLVLSAMGGFAASAAFTGSFIDWPLIVGGLLFIVSDGIIAARVFGDRFQSDVRYELAVWGTYFPAQVLLLLGTAWLY